MQLECLFLCTVLILIACLQVSSFSIGRCNTGIPTGRFPSLSSHRLQKTLNRRTLLFAGAFDKDVMELTEENAELVIEEVRSELGTIFGYDKASQEVGITGEIKLEEIEGPTLYVSLSGRFWHATDTVMLRVESFVKQRIPEVVEVLLDMEKSDIKDDNRLNTDGGKGRLY